MNFKTKFFDFLNPKIKIWVERNLTANKKFYDKMTSFYKAFINPNDLVFDIGANIGRRTYIFREIGARVVSIEPQAECLTFLKKLFSNDTEVKIIEYALGEKKGVGELSISSETNVISTMSQDWITKSRFADKYNETITQVVMIETLDEIIKQFGCPKYCKVDVEGFEKNVFKGLKQKIPLISFEFTKELFDNTLECLSILEKINPIKVNYSLEESFDLYFKEWADKDLLIDSIGSNPDEKMWGDIYVKML